MRIGGVKYQKECIRATNVKVRAITKILVRRQSIYEQHLHLKMMYSQQVKGKAKCKVKETRLCF